MDIAIRNASQADYESLALLFRQVHDLHVRLRPDLYKENQNPVGKELLESQLNDAKHHIFVATIGWENTHAIRYRIREKHNGRWDRIDCIGEECLRHFIL